MTHRAVTDVAGVRVGHATDREALTGCTVLLFAAEPGDPGAVGACDVRGAAPGTRETDLLAPGRLVERIHALLFTGGSAFGLDAATGVVRFLEEAGIGFDAGVARVPIVPAAVVFDLAVGDPRRRPDAAMGYEACRAADAGPVAEGNVGAGTGATVGKLFGPAHAMRGGLGTWSVHLDNGAVVGALAVVNAFGDVRDWRTQRLLAGTRNPVTGRLVDTAAMLRRESDASALAAGWPAQHTTLVAVVTDVALDRVQLRQVAVMAHDGLALSVSPVHTWFDVDAVFCAAAVEAVAEAVRRAVLAAEGLPGLPACRDLFPEVPEPGAG